MTFAVVRPRADDADLRIAEVHETADDGISGRAIQPVAQPKIATPDRSIAARRLKRLISSSVMSSWPKRSSRYVIALMFFIHIRIGAMLRERLFKLITALIGIDGLHALHE